MDVHVRLKLRVKKHVPVRWLEHAGTPVGDAVAALHYLGKAQITPETFAALERSLGKEHFTAFKEALPSLPDWVSERFYEAERSRTPVAPGAGGGDV